MNEINAVFNIYDDYKDKFTTFTELKSKIIGYDNALQKTRKSLETNKQEIRLAEYDLRNAENTYAACLNKYNSENKTYSDNVKRRTDYIDTAVRQYEEQLKASVSQKTMSFGELTDDKVYETYVKKESDNCELSKHKYINRRTEEIKQSIKKYEKEADLFITAPAAATDKVLSETWGSDTVLKKAERLNSYLNASRKIKYSDPGKRMRSAIDNGAISLNASCDSTYELTRTLMRLPDTSRLATRNTKDEADAKNYVSQHPGGVQFVSITLAILMLLGFIYVFPLDDYLPHVFNTENWWWIFGWLAWLLNAGRLVLVWALQIAICIAIWFSCVMLFSETSMATLFYWPEDKVMADLKSFEGNFRSHQQDYIHLMHYKQAVEAVEKRRVEKALREEKLKLSQIENEEGFHKIIDQYNLSLKQLQDRRNQQLVDKQTAIRKANIEKTNTENEINNKVAMKRRKMNEDEDRRIQAVNSSLQKAKYDVASAEKGIEICKRNLDEKNAQEMNCRKIIHDMEESLQKCNAEKNATYETLKKYTDTISRPDFIITHAFELATPEGIAAVDGVLHDSLFFISEKKNEDGILTFSEIPFENRPTIFFYDLKELKTSNLSNELAGVISMMGNALQRVNPIPLFFDRQLYIIDTVTGAEIFKENTNHGLFSVISTPREINDFTSALYRQMNLIRMACEELYVDTNIKTANIEKAKINRSSYPRPRLINEMQEQYCTYTVAFFIMPNESKGHLSSNQVINEEMKRYFQNCEIYGFTPIFLIDYDTWTMEDPSSSIAYLHKVCNTKDFRYIYGINQGQDIRISLQPQRG